MTAKSSAAHMQPSKPSHHNMDSFETVKKPFSSQMLLTTNPNPPRAPIHTLPYPRNPKFFGPLHGLGGIGKSQIALEYAYRRLNNYQAVIWVHAETWLSLSKSFAGIAAALELGDTTGSDMDINVYRELALAWLNATEAPWLLVFDNVEDFEHLAQYWPSSTTSGHVIVTTRRRSLSYYVGSNGLELEVPVFTAEEGAAALLSWFSRIHEPSSQDIAAALELSHQLGGLPLALIQMCGVIITRRLSISQFLKRYQKHSNLRRLSHKEITPYYDRSLDTIWLLSFSQLGSRSYELLGILSFLDPDSISEELMLKHEHDSSFFCEDQVELDCILEDLLNSALLRIDHETRVISIHRLVQAQFRSQLTKEQLAKSFQLACAYILQRLPPLGDTDEQRELDVQNVRLLQPHILALEQSAKEIPSSGIGEDFLALLNRARLRTLITELPNQEQVGIEFDNQGLKDSTFSDSGYGGSESSDPTPTIVSAITQIVQFLIADASLFDISKDIIDSRGAEGFESIFAILLKIYSEDLSKVALREYEHQVCKLIDAKRRDIAARFQSLISPSNKKNGDNLSSFLQSFVGNKDNIERFLKTLPDPNTTRTQKESVVGTEEHSETVNRNVAGLGVDSKTGIPDTAEEDLDDIEIAEHFLLEGLAFSTLKENMKRVSLWSETWLLTETRKDELRHDDTAGQVSQTVEKDSSQISHEAPLEDVMPPQSLASQQLLYTQGQIPVFAILLNLLKWILRIVKFVSGQVVQFISASVFLFEEIPPLLEPGRVRLHWGCDCGKTFFYDVPSLDWQSLVSKSKISVKSEQIWNESREDGFSISDPGPDTSTAANESQASVEQRDMSITYATDSDSARGARSRSEELSRSSQDGQGVALVEPMGMRNRKRTTLQQDEDKWILVCLPGRFTRKDPGTIKHLCAKTNMEDNNLLQEIKRYYESGRSEWDRIRRLHGFSKVRLIKFRLLKIGGLEENIWASHKEWAWPSPKDKDWEYQVQDIGVEIFDQYMLHKWNNLDHRTTSREKALDARHRAAKPWIWLRRQFSKVRSIRGHKIAPTSELHTPAIKVSVGPSTEYEGEPSSSNSGSISRFKNFFSSIFQPFQVDQIMLGQHMPENLQNEVREVDIDPGDCWVFYSTPKKVKEKLAWSGHQPPPGWGICVEEKFSIPWYVIVILGLVPTVTIGFAVGWWVHHGPTTFGVASAVVGWFSFIFTLWVAILKDSED